MESDSRDLGHLQLLAVFHFVSAGIGFLVGCIPVIHVAVGYALFTGLGDDGTCAPPIVGAIMMFVGAAIILFAWAVSAATAYAGYCLLKQKGYVYCLTIAALSCFSIPFGTVLGVFTIVVLMRPSVRARFP